MKINFANELFSKLSFFLVFATGNIIRFFPVLFLIFMAYGDQFLPKPLDKYSIQTRTTISNILTIGDSESWLKNNKYNNRKSDEVIKEY